VLGFRESLVSEKYATGVVPTWGHFDGFCRGLSCGAARRRNCREFYLGSLLPSSRCPGPRPGVASENRFNQLNKRNNFRFSSALTELPKMPFWGSIL
jgi:hypothetical protein